MSRGEKRRKREWTVFGRKKDYVKSTLFFIVRNPGKAKEIIVENILKINCFPMWKTLWIMWITNCRIKKEKILC